MATNLVSEIAEVLSPNIVSSIASALGLNRTATQKAVVAAVPALLAALISYVSKPQGASQTDRGRAEARAGSTGKSGQRHWRTRPKGVDRPGWQRPHFASWWQDTFRSDRRRRTIRRHRRRRLEKLDGPSWAGRSGFPWPGTAGSRSRCLRARQFSDLAKEQCYRRPAFWVLEISWRYRNPR